MRLGVLRMGPFQAEVPGLEEIGAAAFTRLVVGVGEAEGAVELVVHPVPGVDVHAPRAERIQVTGQGEVEIVADDEIHAHIPEIETAGILFAEGRHQESRRPLRFLRDEAEGDADGEGDVFEGRPGGPEDRLLGRPGNDLRIIKVQVIMRVFQVADGIHAVHDADRPVGRHVDVLALQDAVILLRDHVLDDGLLVVEIVPELLHLVGLPVLGHLRPALPVLRHRIERAFRIDDAGVHVVFHVVGGQFHVLVTDRDITIIIYDALSVREDFDDRILGR